MLPKEVIEHFTKDSEEEWYIVEYMVSSILPKKTALEEYNHMNMKTVDNVKLYQVKGNQPILEKEKGL